MSKLFEPEQILSKREIKSKFPKNKKVFEYLIKWKNYDTPTWEPAHCVKYCPKLLTIFNKNNLSEKSPKESAKTYTRRSSGKCSKKGDEELSMISIEKYPNRSAQRKSRRPKKRKITEISLLTDSTEEEEEKSLNVPFSNRQKFLFQCAVCDNVSFKDHVLLGEHIKRFHPQRIVNGISQRRAQCGNCGASYIYAHLLSKHPCTTKTTSPSVTSTNFNFNSSWNSNTPANSRNVINSNVPMNPKNDSKITLYQDIFKCLGVDTNMLMKNIRSSETIEIL